MKGTSASARAMDVTPSYWLVMFAASALGTNVGDLWGEILLPGLLPSLVSLLFICAVAIWYDWRTAQKTEAGYWVAVVMMRAAATNLADIMTHDLRLGYVSASVVLAGVTFVAAKFTTPDTSRANSPRVDSAHWTAMFIAGLFGTVAGDFIHHSIGLYIASVLLCAGLACLIVIRHVRAPLSALLFWAIVMTERCAGTAVGDALASRRAVGLGIPLATACTFCLTVMCLWLRAHRLRPAASRVPSSG